MLFLGTISAWFRERSRNIFHYRDGKQWHRADPIQIGKLVDHYLPDYTELLATIRTRLSSVPVGPLRDDVKTQQSKAVVKLVMGCRTIFDLPPLNHPSGAGVTDGEAIGILTAYFLFMEELAEEAGLFQRAPDAESAFPPASPTVPMSASGTAAG